MTTAPRTTENAPKRHGLEAGARRVSRQARNRSTNRSRSPGIQDAVRDQLGGRWIRYGAPDKAIWFAVAELISEAPAIFRRLSSIDVTCLTPTTQSALKREVEAVEEYRDALVAARPGWLEGFYVHGDGTFAAPNRDEREVIVAFDPNPKFAERGSFKGWQAAVAPFVAGQPLPYFAVALALTPPVLRFVPAGYLNPQAEIVGGREIGKTTLGVLAASVWAGNPDADCGGGETWDATLNSLDDVKLGHRDNFLLLDEGNLAGDSLKARREIIRQAVFKLATTGGKRRKGDAVNAEHARVALLSTTNTALADLLDDTSDVRDAAQSRMITIRLSADRPLFNTVPDGFATARAASESLRGVADLYWGAIGRAFVARLVHEVQRDEARLKRRIASALDKYMRLDLKPRPSARVQKSFALVAVAAALAREWHIMPARWGSPLCMIRAVADDVPSNERSNDPSPLDAIRAYVERHRSALINVAELASPLRRAAFEAGPGFLHQNDGRTELLISARRFQSEFPDCEPMMRALRAEGRARTEGGRQPKLTIKTPKAICEEGRAYCIRLNEPGHALEL